MCNATLMMFVDVKGREDNDKHKLQFAVCYLRDMREWQQFSVYQLENRNL